MKRGWIVWSVVLTTAFVALMVLSCSKTSSGEDDIVPGRPTCNQATDCGPEGRLGWVCSPEGRCYSIEEYCYDDDECVDKCVDHICEGGKKPIETDGDSPMPDGDEDAEPDGQQPCEYQCCTDADCPQGNTCDTDSHICVLIIPCDKECCQDHDCEIDPEFGAGFICRFNECVPEDAPCDTECCTQEDCVVKFGEGYICELGNCREDVIHCTPDWKQCCTDDPGNPDCLALGDESTEAILTCNETGDGWDLSRCDEYNDCLSFGDGVTIECFPNGRCAGDENCECPQKCLSTPNGNRCTVPAAGPDEPCYGDECGTGAAVQFAYCPDQYTCCVNTETNEGVCTLSTECGGR